MVVSWSRVGPEGGCGLDVEGIERAIEPRHRPRGGPPRGTEAGDAVPEHRFAAIRAVPGPLRTSGRSSGAPTAGRRGHPSARPAGKSDIPAPANGAGPLVIWRGPVIGCRL